MLDSRGASRICRAYAWLTAVRSRPAVFAVLRRMALRGLCHDRSMAARGHPKGCHYFAHGIPYFAYLSALVGRLSSELRSGLIFLWFPVSRAKGALGGFLRQKTDNLEITVEYCMGM